MSEPDYSNTFAKIAEFAKQFIQEYEDMNKDDDVQDQDDVVYEYISADYPSSAERVTLYTPELSFSKRDGFCRKCRSTGFVKVENKGIDDMYEACECFYDKPVYSVSEIIAYNINNVIYHVVDGKTNVIDNVRDTFSDDDMKSEYKTLFYINKKDCEEFCRRKNYEKDG